MSSLCFSVNLAKHLSILLNFSNSQTLVSLIFLVLFPAFPSWWPVFSECLPYGFRTCLASPHNWHTQILPINISHQYKNIPYDSTQTDHPWVSITHIKNIPRPFPVTTHFLQRDPLFWLLAVERSLVFVMQTTGVIEYTLLCVCDFFWSADLWGSFT